jgi:2-oxoglutarate dehydrogenase E2 component (dihydrolipoamide succinyltransferase)
LATVWKRTRAILEISTDKVDAEVPSPAAGVLLAINTPEGETVEVGTVVAVIGEQGGSFRAGARTGRSPEGCCRFAG